MSQRKVISSPKSCYESVERDVTGWYMYLSYRLTHFQFESLGKRLTASDYVLKTLFKYSSSLVLSIAVITVEPAGKVSFVLGCIQTRLMGQYNGKWPISLVYMSKPLITVITAIDSVFCIVQITSPSLSTVYQGVGKPLYWQKLSPHHLKTGTEPIREGKYLIIWEVQIYEMDSNIWIREVLVRNDVFKL